MPRDFYTRDDTAPKYQSDIMELSDTVSLLIIQIENILFTKRREVIGFPGMGVNLEELLFTFNVNENELIAKVSSNIINYCPLSRIHPVDVRAYFLRGTEKDIALIDIIIEGKKSLSILL